MKLITQTVWNVGTEKGVKEIQPGKRVSAKTLGIKDSEVERYLNLGLLARDPDEIASEDATALEKAQAELEKTAGSKDGDLSKANAEIKSLKDQIQKTAEGTEELKKAAQDENGKLKAEVKKLKDDLAKAKQGSL